MNIQPKITPVLDPGFVPAVLWNQAFEAKAAADPASHPVSYTHLTLPTIA